MKTAEILARDTYARELNVVADIHPDDFIYQFIVSNPSFPNIDQAVKYYFYDGRSSAEKLRRVIEQELGLHDKPIRLLEFASGYGAVTRHLKEAFPTASSVACDIHPAAMEFIQARMGGEVLLSTSAPEDLEPKQLYDVVFALSFFSHMPRETWGRWLSKLYSLVAPNGLLIFTTQGRTSKQFFHDAAFSEDGYWFKSESEQNDIDTSEYGQTLVTPEFVVREGIECLGCEPLLMRMAFWWTHQDMYVFKK